MADVYDQAAKFNAELLAGEQGAVDDLLNAYGRSWQRIKVSADDLAQQIELARAAGEEVGPSWIYRQERYRRLMGDIEREVQRISFDASLITQEAQFEAIEAATENAAKLIDTAAPQGFEAGFTGLQKNVAEQITGNLYGNSPIRALFDGLAAEAQSAATSAILEGVIANQAPAQVARGIRDALGGNAARASTIARTEIIRAHREASRNVYERASIVDQWEWACAKQARTCAMCWAMDGQRFPVGTPMGSHPNCRCTMIPVVDGMAIPPLSGQALFDTKSDDFKLAVLGPGKFDLYKEGDLDLRDLVSKKKHADWGTVRSEKSLKALQANKVKPYKATEAGKTAAGTKVNLAPGTTQADLDAFQAAKMTAAEKKQAVLDKVALKAEAGKKANAGKLAAQAKEDATAAAKDKSLDFGTPEEIAKRHAEMKPAHLKARGLPDKVPHSRPRVITPEMYDELTPLPEGGARSWQQAKNALLNANPVRGQELHDVLRGFQNATEIPRLRENFLALQRGEAVKSRKAKAYLDAIAEAPEDWAPASVYRGTAKKNTTTGELLTKYAEGEEFTLWPSSFTSDKKVATRFATKNAKDEGYRKVIFELKGPKKAIPVERVHSAFFKEKEWITHGKFRVISSTVDRNGRVVVQIEQLEV